MCGRRSNLVFNFRWSSMTPVGAFLLKRHCTLICIYDSALIGLTPNCPVLWSLFYTFHKGVSSQGPSCFHNSLLSFGFPLTKLVFSPRWHETLAFVDARKLTSLKLKPAVVACCKTLTRPSPASKSWPFLLRISLLLLAQNRQLCQAYSRIPFEIVFSFFTIKYSARCSFIS